MSEVIGVGQLSLMDLNDALISGVPPKNPEVGALWIDESLDPPMLKKWNGEGWIDLGELDPNLSVIIEDITETLGNMANDNIINFQERQVIKDKLTEIIGYVIADSTTTLPTVATLDNGGKGNFWAVRKSALNAGIKTSDNVYANLTTRYNNLKSYLEGLTPIDAWDVRSANKDIVIAVTKSTFRDRWLQYYLAVDALAEATANKLKENIDKIDVNGRNFITNGGFMINLDESTWKDYYVGNVKEIVDISAETPPMQFALHVKNTANVNGGIFTPTIFEGAVAESLIGREITLSFWLKHQNIVQGLNSHNLGRFGEIVIEGRKGDNSKVYSYQRVGANGSFGSTYISGTNMTWTKYQGTLKIEMPAGAVAITSISFKHGLEGCKGEFWTTALKLETGNKATDWTPNPLDVEGRVTTVESKVLPDRIVQTVRSSETYKRDLADAKTHADTVAGAVQKDVDDLETAVGNLDKEIKGTFKDGLVTEAEAKSIAKYINILNAEKLDVDNRYNIIYADSNLSGTPKTNLLSAKSGYNTAHNNLMKSINDAVADGKATSTESANVDSKFNSYRSALGLLSTRFEEAIRAIETSKVDSVEIGGRNILIDSGRYIDTTSYQVAEYTLTEDFIEGAEYTLSLKGTKLDTQSFGVWQNGASSSRGNMRHIGNDVYVLTFQSTSIISGNERIIRVYQPTSTTAGKATISWAKLEKGNKRTDWTPAPEDVEEAISGVQDNVDEVYRSLGSLDNEIKGTFKDGLISETEAKSIEKYLNVVNSEKSQLDSRYNTVYADPSLSGTPKSTLTTKKSAYNTAHSNLISSITKAIADGKATTSEKSDVDSKFASYRSSLSELSMAFEDAVSSIAQAKADKSASDTQKYVQSRGENLVTNGTGLLGDNTNFSQWTFDGSQVYAGGGSFFTALQNGSRFNDEMIPVDPSRKYRFSLMAKSKTGLGHNYFGVISYDIDGYSINPYNFYGSQYPITTLAKDLKVGDTQIHLTSSEGFMDNSASADHRHSIVFWGYKNSFGYEYPAGTYSRLYMGAGWNPGAINRTTHVITLNKPFNVSNPNDPNGVFKAGHKVSPTSSGGSYQYMTASNVKVSNTEWQKFEGTITGNGISSFMFPHGTAFVKLMFLVNRSTSGGTAGDNLWVNSLEFTDITFEENAKSHADTIVSAVRKEVEGVDTKVGNLDKEIKGTFKDGIVSEAEAQSISKYINTLSSEKLGVDNRYSTIYSDSKLSGTAKSNLSSAKSSFDTAHNNLITSINNAVKDGKATSAESADVDSKFTSYRSALGTLSTRLEEAVRAIETAKIDSIEIGGRNLLRNSSFSDGTSYWGAVSPNTIKVVSGYNGSKGVELGHENTGSVHPRQSINITLRAGETITMQMKVKTDDFAKFEQKRGRVANQVYLDMVPSMTKILEDGWRLYVYQYTATSTITLSNVIGVSSGVAMTFTFSEMKLERGTKPTDWSPAPEDVDSAIGEKVSTTVYNEKIGSIETGLGKVTAKAGEVEKSVNDLTGEVEVIDTALSKLTIETGKISTTVSSVKATAETAKRDIDELDVGGRNYFVVSEAVEDTLLAWATGTESYSAGALASGFIPVTPGDSFIVSPKSTDQLFYYDENMEYLSDFPNMSGGGRIHIPNDSRIAFMRVVFRNNFLDGRTKYEAKVKIEKGNRATDWTPAPEDVDGAIADKASTEEVTASLQTVAEEYSTAIDDATSALAENIANDIAEMETSITTAYSTAIEQTSTDINISIGEVHERIDGTHRELTEVKSFFTFADDGLTIGRSDSPLSINISNSRMEFRDSGTAVAYIDKQTMYIENVHTLQSFIVGNHKIEKHDNNITIIKWIG